LHRREEWRAAAPVGSAHADAVHPSRGVEPQHRRGVGKDERVLAIASQRPETRVPPAGGRAPAAGEADGGCGHLPAETFPAAARRTLALPAGAVAGPPAGPFVPAAA